MTVMMVDPDGNEWPAETELEVETLRGRGYRVAAPAAPPPPPDRAAVTAPTTRTAPTDS